MSHVRILRPNLLAMAMYREACLDMDNPHQDVQGDALREETRKLQRPAKYLWFGDAVYNLRI